jgi:hypothetical protein
VVEDLKYQLRLTLRDDFAEVARSHADDPSIGPLTQLLCRHDAALKCQYDAFADYVKEAEKRSTPSPSRSMSAATRCTKRARPTRSRPSSSRWSEVRSWRRCSDTTPIPLTIPAAATQDCLIRIALASPLGRSRARRAQSQASASVELKARSRCQFHWVSIPLVSIPQGVGSTRMPQVSRSDHGHGNE